MSLKDDIRTKPKMWASAALVTAGLAGGAILGTTMSANAATTSTTTPAASSASGSSSTAPSIPAHGSAAHENAETTVTGSAASQAQAAAVKYVGSGTAGPVTSNFTKDGYEVTVTKSDGSQVEVHLDSSFNVTQGGGGHGDGDGDGPGATSGSSSTSA